VSAQIKEWLQRHNLEEVSGALQQLGVKTVEQLYMIEEQVRAVPGCCMCATVSGIGHAGLSARLPRLGPRRGHAWLQRHSRSCSGDSCDRPYLKRDLLTHPESF